MSQNESTEKTEKTDEILNDLGTRPSELDSVPAAGFDSDSGSEQGDAEMPFPLFDQQPAAATAAEAPEEPPPSPAGPNYSSDEFHDEVECLLAGTNAEIMELIATDPKYYLDIVQNYTRMRDGREIYLPDLFNILVSRSNGGLKIKFKMSDNTQWYEIGFNGGDFSDRDVYKAFSEKVNALIRNPPQSRRDFLNDTMKPEVKEPAVMTSQGNQYKLSKIDRFLGRSENSENSEQSDDLVPGAISQKKVSFQIEDPEPEPAPAPAPASAPAVQAQAPAAPAQAQAQAPAPAPAAPTQAEADQLLNSVVQAFKSQLRARLHESSPNGLPALSDCPVSKRADYAKLLAVINSDSPFIQGLVESLPNSTPGQRLLVADFLHNLRPTKTEAELADQLNLSEADRQLIRTYNIKLSDLQN